MGQVYDPTSSSLGRRVTGDAVDAMRHVPCGQGHQATVRKNLCTADFLASM